MLIALVGRPNVGKSTLFNRLIGQRKAVVSSTRGTTRDRLCAPLQWRGVPLTLMDMGGVDLARTSGLAAAVQAHVQRAFQEADGFMFVCDAQEGLVPADELILDRLRKTNKPIVLAANKADHRLVVPPEFFALGVTPACAVSAVHGRGTGELLDALLARFTPPRLTPVAEDAQGLRSEDGPGPAIGPPMLRFAKQNVGGHMVEQEHFGGRDVAPRRGTFDGATPPRGGVGLHAAASAPSIPTVAIIGRQNVGKSSLLNAWLREERVIVSDVPGTTRDAVETRLLVGCSPVRLIDTAGLRHRRKVKDPIDYFAMSRAVEVIERCDVVLVVLDATQGITRDDQRIIARVCEAGRGCVLVVNKWDLVAGGRLRALPEAVRSKIPAGLSAPVLAVSAKTGFQVFDVLNAALRVHRMMRSGLKDEAAQALLTRAWAAHRPPRYRGRVVQLRGARWLVGRPRRLELQLRPVAWLPSSYQHYLLRQVQSLPALSGIPIALLLRGPESR